VGRGLAYAYAKPSEKIDAIKAYREATGADLRDAKEYVEELERRTKH
jgi:ribosomal protein L7/L12